MTKQQPWEYEDANVVLFWGGILSNWYICDFDLDGVKYTSAEQHMMAEKARQFDDAVSEAKIMAEQNPRQQKLYGRQIPNFDVDVWKDVCVDRCYPGIKAKFEQNESLKQLLLATGDKRIAEASPYDRIWGIGLGPDNILARDEANWNGDNLLGEILMLIRQEFRDVNSN
jgi:ribA/ribD-fused uncharacterized protein